MEVIKKMPPGAPGTKRFLQEFGGQLVCVRYRGDPVNGRRVTTIELIVEERTADGEETSKPLPEPA